MKYNLILLAVTLIAIIVLAIVFNMFYMRYLEKLRLKNVENAWSEKNFVKKNGVLSIIGECVSLNGSQGTCPVELPNSDDDVGDVLEYIDKAKFASELLEKLYEQTGV